MGISRDQFLRGIAAIERYQTMRRAIQAAMEAGGIQELTYPGSGDDLLSELTKQLEERCNDPQIQHGSMIAYMLYDCGGPVHLADGRKFMTKTAEQLWTYWEASATGPFEP